MADFYFDGTNGNNAGIGNAESPYRTIRNSTVGGIFNPATPRFFIKRGTTVIIEQGIYPQGSFYVGPYGEGNEPAVLVSNYGFTGGAGTNYLVTGGSTTSADTIVFENLTLQDADPGSFVAAVYTTTSNAAPVTVRDCVITGFFIGVMTQGGNRHQILRNRVVNYRNCGIMFEHASSAAANNSLIEGNYVDGRLGATVATNDCIVLHNGTSNGYGNVIRGNTCISSKEQCIDVLEMYPGTIVENNICYARQDGTSSSWSDIFTRAANSIIRNNLIFCRYRIGLDIDSANVLVSGNTFVGLEGAVGDRHIRLYTGCSNPTIENNYFIGRSGYASSMIQPVSGVTTGTIRNNMFVNYSSVSSCRFISAQVSADLNTWTINNNYYSRMPGSHSSPWAGNVNFATWRARTGSPDANSYDTTALPLPIPEYAYVGQTFDLSRLYEVLSGNPLIGAGAHTGYRRLGNGARYNPPTIGPMEYIRPREARS